MSIESLAMLEKVVIASLPADRPPSEAEVFEQASSFRKVIAVSDEEFDLLIKRLHAKLAITMDLGTALFEEDHVPWLSARSPDIDPFYWERFRAWLGRLNWPPRVVNALDGVADDILDLAGDPTRSGAWRRRGLVVGDVQSGKTATYTALTCKAADAGFRLIILLTGTLESLRRQTQERLDEGFVGLDSSEMLQRQVKTSRAIGVGVIDHTRSAGVFTSRSRDFSRQLMTQLGFRLDAFQQPVLVVLKKNKKVLENLENWLRSYNAGPDGKIAAPLLLIDDEADSASINTNRSSADPTSINERIRLLLGLFHRYSYIGFTATPFANVFIDPDTVDAMVGDDLFPRDYIYGLEAPTNYMGPQAIFGYPRAEILRSIDDADAFFPANHKSAHLVDSLPESLIEAVRSFILATTLRDMRGEGPTHRSMLVNVSRFTNVQDQVAGLLDAELRNWQRDIRNFSQLAPDEALEVPAIAALHATWSREYGTAGFEWAAVQRSLHESAQPISVRSVNQRSSASNLDYKAYRENGLRVIAVGGNSLSRGLTLEGLSTSYFFRNSQMYDTLLQMGRWFGYRDGYQDLCRLWLTDEAVHWYSHITVASDELRGEIKRMKRLDLTPKDFGLKVRAHPDSLIVTARNKLIVTARNKMRLAQTITRNVSLSGAGVETSRLRSNPDVVQANSDAAERFIQQLIAEKNEPKPSEWGSFIWRNVPKEIVATFLLEFETHPLNYDFQAPELGTFLKGTTEPSLQTWDVVIPKGSLDKVPFGGIYINPIARKVVVRRDNRSILISGASARVGSRGIEREGLSIDQFERVRAAHAGKNIPDSAFREVRVRPLLLLHIVRGHTGKITGSDKFSNASGPLLVAIGLSFPAFDDTGIAQRVEYKVNLVEWRSMFEQEEDDDVPSEDDIH
jgi:hypothetical protein